MLIQQDWMWPGEEKEQPIRVFFTDNLILKKGRECIKQQQQQQQNQSQNDGYLNQYACSKNLVSNYQRSVKL